MTKSNIFAAIVYFVSVLAACISDISCRTHRPWEQEWLQHPVAYPQPIASSSMSDDGESVPASRDEESENYVIDLPTVVRLSKAQNLDIAYLRERLHEAHARTLTAGQQFLPTLRFSTAFFRHEGRIQDTSGEFLDDVDKQNIFLGGRIAGEIRPARALYDTLAAEQRYQAGEAQLAQVEMQTMIKAAGAYFDLAHFYAQAQVIEQARQYALTYKDESEKYIQLGRGEQGALLQAQAELAQNESRLAEVKKNIELSAIHLAGILRLTPQTRLYPEESPEPVDFVAADATPSSLSALAVQRHPQVKEAEYLLEALALEKDAALYAPLFPSVYGHVQFGALGPRTSDLKDQEQYGIGLAWEIGPGGLFDFGAGELAEARYEQVRIAQAQVRERIAEEVYESHARIMALRSSMTSLRQAMAQSERVLKLNEERQRLGVGTPLEVIQAQRDLTQARLNYLGAVKEYNQTQFRLYVLVGNTEVKK